MLFNNYLVLMINVFRKFFITLLAIVSLFLLLFAGFPNRTGFSIGFEINLENILLYCVLPFVFVIGILIIGILVFLSIKTKKDMIFLSIILGLCSLIMLIYAIYLSIISVDWIIVGLPFNLSSTVILLALAIVLPLIKRKTITSKVV